MPVVMGALCKCTMGAAPVPLVVLPTPQVFAEFMPAATIMDFIPFMNVMPFGVCKSIACPTTAALTAAALGVLTPGPCIPMPVGPWMPPTPAITVMGLPALSKDSKLMCAFGGQITIQNPGAPTVS